MIVCHCGVVSSRDIAEALDAGARGLDDVCRMTGAAQNCGSCVFSVQRIVCQHEQHESVAEEAMYAAG
jgi:bacterioferritin-associated ferredoxin